jgi:TRAP-type mannitol/chloroaromatic compound transport system permease small subunit
LKKTIRGVTRIISRAMLISMRINGVLAWASCIFLFLMMFYVVIDVVGRQVFSLSVPGTLQIGQSVLVFAVFLSLAYVLIYKEHVRVTVLFEKLPPRWQKLLELLAFALGCAMMFIIAWQVFLSARYSFEIREPISSYGDADFPLPVYPAKFACFVGSVLLCIQFFLEFLNRIFDMPGVKFTNDVEVADVES